jgi:hypothetical protein
MEKAQLLPLTCVDPASRFEPRTATGSASIAISSGRHELTRILFASVALRSQRWLMPMIAPSEHYACRWYGRRESVELNATTLKIPQRAAPATNQAWFPTKETRRAADSQPRRRILP